MDKRIAALLVVGGMALSACAGGGGGGSTAPVTTTVTTNPTTGSSTVTTNANLTNLTVSQAFANAGSSAVALVNVNGPTVGAAALTPAALDAFSIAYNASTQGYTISGAGLNQTFLPSDKSSASTAIATAYSKTSGNIQDTLGLFNPGTANTRLNLTYTSYGNWLHAPTSGSATSTAAFFVYGIPTAASDMPKTGTATYQTAVGGFWEASNDLRVLSGSGTLSADFGAGTTQVTLSLTGTSSFSGATSTLGNFSGAGVINSTAATFSGNLGSTSTASAGYAGAYAGRFFGPAATEAGAAFSLANSAGAAVTGVIVGKK